jgi:RNA polymerase sigma-70 factor, ECF subfamily
VIQQDGATHTAQFAAARPKLMAAAIGILGDVGEAEDLMQETWIRWNGADRALVISPPAFLAVTITRLAINVAQSARKRRETAAGPWLPEAVDRAAGPDALAETNEAVERAIRLLLEKLTPAERAAYLLRKAFDYPYRRISEVLRLGVDHARQLVVRAHERLAGDRRQPVDPVVHRRLVRAFRTGARTGNLTGLEELLAADVAEASGWARRRSCHRSSRWPVCPAELANAGSGERS